MKFSRHRPFGLPAFALLLSITACSSTEDSATAPIPSPEAKVAELCRNLDKVLPQKVDGLERNDPEPPSPLTAGWGSPAIILRCGVPRPAELNTADALGATVDGVGWLVDKRDDGSVRFTTTLRRAYVEVTLPKERAGDGAGPLTGFAKPIASAIPEGIAD
ncbi:DUF3515 domain-containing protein [Streptomyces cavernae]|uniref:DUF3515 domain-containing protein n=1 Tax=Streptomyces cavernae TaxID=2259034 RepID=UPI000FEB6DA4|nr:DUF3515 domain-containing protein [Streptomyces cavernae]